MSRIRQDTQVRSSDLYDDTLPAGSSLESATSIENDLNAVRSQISRLLRAFGGNWYDDLVAPTDFESGARRGVSDLNQDLHDLERKRILVGVDRVADVTVPAGHNWVVLSSGSLPSTTTAAIGTVDTLGSVVAHATLFDSHCLDTVPGGSVLSPANVCVVVDAATLAPILSSNRPVFALLQSESATDGSTLTDSAPNRVQLSFVRPDSVCLGLEAVPVADIETRVVRYRSTVRKPLLGLNEYDLIPGITGVLPSSGPPSPTSTTISVTCLSTDIVGACVYAKGISGPSVYDVETVNLEFWSTSTAIGILVSKTSATTGIVQLSGIAKSVYTGLVPGATYVIGTSGQISATTPTPAPGHRIFIQKMGWAVSADEFLVAPSVNVTILQG